MVETIYRFGLLLTLFGGFLSLNSSHFGGLDSLFESFAIFMLVTGTIIGVFGLAVTTG